MIYNTATPMTVEELVGRLLRADQSRQVDVMHIPGATILIHDRSDFAGIPGPPAAPVEKATPTAAGVCGNGSTYWQQAKIGPDDRRGICACECECATPVADALLCERCVDEIVSRSRAGKNPGQKGRAAS